MTKNVYKLSKPLIVTGKNIKNAIKLKNGMYSDELWGLDYTLAYFMVPRLVEFKKGLYRNYQSKIARKYEKIINEIIEGMELLIHTDALGDPKVTKAFTLLGKNVQKFWT
jgi:hypothetical protein